MVYLNHPLNPSIPSPLPGACVPATTGTHAELLVLFNISITLLLTTNTLYVMYHLHAMYYSTVVPHKILHGTLYAGLKFIIASPAYTDTMSKEFKVIIHCNGISE